MKRHVVTGLKVVASVPLAVLIGTYAAKLLELGLWPLLFIPDAWMRVVDMVLISVCQVVLLGGLIWFWALDRR